MPAIQNGSAGCRPPSLRSLDLRAACCDARRTMPVVGGVPLWSRSTSSGTTRKHPCRITVMPNTPASAAANGGARSRGSTAGWSVRSSIATKASASGTAAIAAIVPRPPSSVPRIASRAATRVSARRARPGQSMGRVDVPIDRPSRRALLVGAAASKARRAGRQAGPSSSVAWNKRREDRGSCDEPADLYFPRETEPALFGHGRDRGRADGYRAFT